MIIASTVGDQLRMYAVIFMAGIIVLGCGSYYFFKWRDSRGRNR